ncbi:hypothetical protein [Leeuwenhoekiella nanhaiensis]|uniref:Sugar transporter n=1 Tax=Leeuwenhoekiella nanhaiensis TaxID=1655491 RepID=A0A2G1VV31_9FLAO|nr:hypothetical protein [Leeuwenhoekiella nanhaiensis]PHQ30626.1 hypothetical protein CJ305_04495 [Leeuwenhoekiella nanhaiensis]
MSATRPPRSFWIITSLAIFWNLMGFIAFTSQSFMSSAMLAELPPDQAELIRQTPQWLKGVFAVATITGLLGSFLLVLLRSAATTLFLISLVGVLIQMGYSLFATNALQVYGILQGLLLPLFVVIIAVYLYIFSRRCAAKGYLRRSS